MSPAKRPGKKPARSKAGEKRHIVLPGKPFYAVVAGLALAASLAVLALVLFGPFPPLPWEQGGLASKARQTGSQASAASRPHGPAAAPAPTRPAQAPPRQAELPFEEHLAGRDAPPPSPAPAPEVRIRLESAPPVATAAPGPVDTTPEAQPVPGDAGKGPRMVVVVDDMGDHPVMAKNLMDLPFPVTLAILPDRPRTRSIEAQAAAQGVEVILHQPMQPGSYPRVNPGPGAVFTDMDARRVQDTLADNLSQLPHAVGVNNHMGSAFTSDAPGMAAVMPVLKARGLFFLDSVTSAASAAPDAARQAGVPFFRRAVFLDNVRNTRTILGQLRTAERHALKHGRAIAIGHPYGETLEALKIWARERDSRVAVVTLTELGPEF